MADDGNESWESTMQSNSTPSSKQSAVNFTHLSKSIKNLGDKATEAAKIQAKELQKNCMHKSQVLQKTHQHKSLEREDSPTQSSTKGEGS
jgi:arginine utilization protein RocB